jgi:hypothetical protein
MELPELQEQMELLELLVKVLIIVIKLTTDHTLNFPFLVLTEAVTSLLIFQLELQG